MFFQESEAIALEHPDLLGVIEQVDRQLSGIRSSAPLRPTDFACALGAEENQVLSVFELLAAQGTLIAEEMLECGSCHNLMPVTAFRTAIEDEDEFVCSGCSRAFRKRSNPILVFRLSPKSTCRLDDLVPTSADSAVNSSTVAAEATANSFQRHHETWILSFDGKTVPMKNLIGLVYIARLLSEPNRDIAGVSLMAARAGIDPRVATGSLGPILTEQARQDYRRRYSEIQEELAEAERYNDLGRVDKLKREMDVLMIELEAATGLGGRRREKSDADRVRRSASMAITRSITKIKAKHPALGRHLKATITCGYTFRYSLEPPIYWLT